MELYSDGGSLVSIRKQLKKERLIRGDRYHRVTISLIIKKYLILFGLYARR